MAEPPPHHRHRRARRLAWGAGIATASALVAFGAASWQAQAAPSPATTPGAGQFTVSDPGPAPERAAGTGRDPITGAEAQRARSAALTTGLTGEPTDVTGGKGPELLSTDLMSGAGRHAEVLLYDYSSNRTVKQVVDLETGTVDKTFAAAGLQPPASAREVRKALELLLADPLGTRLTGAYASATGKPYTKPEQLHARAHIYQARPADTGAEQCGQHRCLSLVVQATENGTFLDLRDVIIDLSGRTVARLK